jgi:hypothetical protein
MSKKSRKRNKRLLALAGLAGAVALANRKPKQSDVSQDSGRGSGLRDTVDTKKTTPKKDTTVTTPRTIQDNKYKGPRNTKSIRVKENTNKVYTDATGGESTAKVANPKSTFEGKDGYLRKGENATPMTPGPRGTARAASEMSRGMLPPQLRKPRASNTFGPGNDGLSSYKSGGRAGYKSGGSTGSSKSSGCAIKGISPILMKGRK